MNFPRPLLAGVLLFAYCGLLFFPFLGQRDLTSSHEARAAQNAQMILDEGHWLLPQLLDRHLELQKPPMYYWLVALIGRLHGGHVDVWAVRLPAALSALACVLFLYLVGLRAARPIAGWAAGLILASCLHFTWLAQVGRIDMPLTLAITVSLGSFYLGSLENRRIWHIAAYVALGFGMLLKGPIALVLPAAVLAATWLIRSRQFDWRSSTLWWGIPLALAIAAPWYIWTNHQTHNQLWEVFFWYHNVERGLGGAEALAAHPWWFYGPRMAIDLLPWSLTVPIAVAWFLRDPDLRRDDAAYLGLIWFGAVALFLSLMRFKRADYLLPAYPGLAIFLGVCAERWWTRLHASTTLAQILKSVALVTPAFVAAGWVLYNIWLMPAEEKTWAYRQMALEIRTQTQKPVVFFRAESHLLAYHLGYPVATILEWENLEIWTQRPFPVYFVMPESCVHELRAHLADGVLEEVLRTTDYVNGQRDRPLVVMRSRGRTPAAP